MCFEHIFFMMCAFFSYYLDDCFNDLQANKHITRTTTLPPKHLVMLPNPCIYTKYKALIQIDSLSICVLK